MENYVGNALTQIGQMRQQKFQNSLAMRDQGMQEQQFAANQNALNTQQTQQQQKMNAEQALAGARLVRESAKKGLNPKLVAEQIAPNFVQDFEKTHGQGSWQQLQPEQILSMVDMLEQKSMAQLGISPEAPAPQMESIQGPRGSILQRDPRTGEMKQVVGPDNTQAATGMTPYQQAQLELQQRRLEMQERSKGGGNVALPVGALKLVDETQRAIDSAAESLSLVDRASQKLDQVNLGLVSNTINRGRNIAGVSSESSRAFADVKQTFEKLRNNYLLLAKGVQTEGDATRAWNSEIGESVQNDNKLAKQQLEKAKALMQQMVEAQNMRIDSIYANYGGARPEAGSQPTATAQPAQGQSRTGATVSNW